MTFGKSAFKATGEDCVYPLQVLRYASVDVLITQTGVPGEGCHGCGAPLSAFVLRNANGGIELVKHFSKFATLGTFGAVMDISPFQIGGDDGMAVETGGTFQGFSSTAVDFFAFHNGQLVALNNETPIMLDADNAAGVTDGSKAIEVSGKWSLDPADRAVVVVDYRIKARGAVRVERVKWRLQGKSLVLFSGRVPEEVSEAAGGG